MGAAAEPLPPPEERRKVAFPALSSSQFRRRSSIRLRQRVHRLSCCLMYRQCIPHASK